MGVRFNSPSSSKIEDLCLKLAREIKSSGFEPDMVVGVCRGGWVPARFLADFLGDIREVASVRAIFYTGINKTKAKVKITQPVSASVRGKNVLLVDDVADTGHTLASVVTHLINKGAREVRVAVLHYKPWSVIKPDYFAAKTTDWVIYPWMIRETINELKGKDLRLTGIPKKKIEVVSRL